MQYSTDLFLYIDTVATSVFQKYILNNGFMHFIHSQI